MGDWESMLAVVIAILIAYGVVLWLGTIVWVYRDIRGRTQDGWTQAVSLLIVAIFNLPGLFLYLVLRPQETLNDAYERRLEAEALMRDMPEPSPVCPTCRQTVRHEYLVCPNCSTILKEACSKCAKPLQLTWMTCPYCAADGPKRGPKADTASATKPPPAPATQPPRSATPPPRAAALESGPPTTAKPEAR